MGKRRLASLLHRLLIGPATMRDLAEVTQMSRRTVARDIKLLTTAGLPVYTQPGRGGGLILVPSSSRERFFLEQVVRRQDGLGTDEELLGMLVAHFRANPASRVPGESERETLDALRRAVLAGRCVHLSYLSLHGRIHRENVCPQRVFMRRGQWCFSAVPASGGPEQLLVVSSVCALGPARAAPPVRKAPSGPPSSDTVDFLFPGSMALQLLSAFSKDAIFETDTGDILIRPQTPDDVRCIGYYMSRCVPIQPIGPEELLDDAVRSARAAYHQCMPHYRCPARSR